MQSKALEKEAMRAQAKEANERKRAKQFMDKGDMESAKMIAGEAIRFRQEGTNLMRMAGKMSAVSAKLDSAYRTQQVSAQIKNSIPGLQSCLAKINASGVQASMGQFEKVFEDLDVTTEALTGSLDVVASSATDQTAVNSLLQEMQSDMALQQQNQIG